MKFVGLKWLLCKRSDLVWSASGEQAKKGGLQAEGGSKALPFAEVCEPDSKVVYDCSVTISFMLPLPFLTQIRLTRIHMDIYDIQA